MRYTFGDFDLDTDAYKLSRANQELRLQPQVFDVLRYLVEHRERVVSKDELLDALWRDAHVNETAVTWSISHARRALGQERGNKAPIETVHGRGYRFVAELRAFDSNPEAVAEGGGPREQNRPNTSVKLPFVGRGELMGQLQAQLLEAQSGAGKLCLLQGEAGIGKTRCATELGYLARGRGFSVLIGRSVEGVGAPVFWPWQQVLRGLMQERPDLRAAASATVTRLSAAEAAPESDGAAAGSRVRLFDDVTQLLLLAARTTPLLLLFDDMHWADAGTIELLSFAAPEIGLSKIMVVGTLREEPSANNTRALSALSQRAQNLAVGYFSPDDIARYIADFTQAGEPSPELSAAVFAATAGNPLFVQETVRTLVADKGPSLRRLTPAAIQPSKLARDVLRAPLRALEPDALALLSVASVLGETFELSLLKEVAGIDIDALLDRLDAALQRGFVLAEAPNRYRFRHALIRAILYDDVKPTERVTTHRKAAQLLSLFPDREQRGSEIAIHYYKSLAAGDAGVVSKAAQDAAHAAERVHAFQDASQFYQWALEAQSLDTAATTRSRAELLWQCGRAQRWAGRETDSRQTLETATRLSSEHGYGDLLVKIVRILRPTYSMGLVPDELVRDALEQALHTAPQGANRQRISALSQLACIPPISLDLEQSKQTSALALRLARESTDDPAPSADEFAFSQGRLRPEGRGCLIEALRARLYSLSGPDDVAAVLEVCDEIIALDRPSSDVSRDALTARFSALMYRGDHRGAMNALESIGQLANSLNLIEARWFYERHRAQALLTSGQIDAAEKATQVLRDKGTRIGLSYGKLLVKALQVAIAAMRDGMGALTDAVDMSGALWPPELPKVVASYGLLIATEAGEFERVRRNWEQLVQHGFDDVPKEISYLLTLSNCAVVASLIGDRPRAERLYELLAPYPGYDTPDLMLIQSGSVSYFLARLAVATGRTNKIEEHFQAAIEMNARIEHGPQLAQTHYEYARWLCAQPEESARERGRSHAQQALQSSERFGIPWLISRTKQLL